MRGCFRSAVADAHHIADAEKKMRLAKGDAAIDHLRRARDDEHAVFIFFELGELMRLESVLDRKLMQRELAPDPLEQGLRGLVEADPNDMAFAPGPVAGLVNRDIGDLAAAVIDGRGDDAGFMSPCRRRPLLHGRAPAVRTASSRRASRRPSPAARRVRRSYSLARRPAPRSLRAASRRGFRTALHADWDRSARLAPRSS